MHVGLLLQHFELPEALYRKKALERKQNGHWFAVKASEVAKSPGRLKQGNMLSLNILLGEASLQSNITQYAKYFHHYSPLFFRASVPRGFMVKASSFYYESRWICNMLPPLILCHILGYGAPTLSCIRWAAQLEADRNPPRGQLSTALSGLIHSLSVVAACLSYQISGASFSIKVFCSLSACRIQVSEASALL